MIQAFCKVNGLDYDVLELDEKHTSQLYLLLKEVISDPVSIIFDMWFRGTYPYLFSIIRQCINERIPKSLMKTYNSINVFVSGSIKNLGDVDDEMYVFSGLYMCLQGNKSKWVETKSESFRITNTQIIEIHDTTTLQGKSIMEAFMEHSHGGYRIHAKLKNEWYDDGFWTNTSNAWDYWVASFWN